MKLTLPLIAPFISLVLPAQKKSFRFAFLSDTHKGPPNGAAEKDLRTPADINRKRRYVGRLAYGETMQDTVAAFIPAKIIRNRPGR